MTAKTTSDKTSSETHRGKNITQHYHQRRRSKLLTYIIFLLLCCYIQSNECSAELPARLGQWSSHACVKELLNTKKRMVQQLVTKKISYIPQAQWELTVCDWWNRQQQTCNAIEKLQAARQRGAASILPVWEKCCIGLDSQSSCRRLLFCESAVTLQLVVLSCKCSSNVKQIAISPWVAGYSRIKPVSSYTFAPTANKLSGKK